MPIALVTGSAGRIGRVTLLALARAGFDAVLHGRKASPALDGVADEVTRLGRKAFRVLGDLSDEGAPEAIAAQVKGHTETLDLLVNNASAYEHRAFSEVTPAAFDTMVRTNLRAPFFLTQALLPLLRASGAGAIVNITDMAVSHAYTATHFFAHYLASKAGLEQLTRAWALELGPALRVNAVAPGPVAMASETTDTQRREMLARSPLRREGSVDDVAQAIVYLATAPYVTGQTLRVDGGLSVT
jgi:pteridine reductase